MFGAMPPKIASTSKCSLAAAEQLYNTFHYTLYPGLTKYREDYVLPQTKKDGDIHLGFGLRIISSNPNRDIRSLNNVTIQFYDVITLIALEAIQDQINKAGYAQDILPVNTIYDALYFEIREDPKIIKWLNDTLIPIMTTQLFEEEFVPNVANLDIGKNLGEQYELPHNATIKQINETLQKIKEK